jgi:chitooligosaccharide deacetylase
MGLGPVVLWSVAAVDWNARESGPIVERVLEGVAPGAIVVLHDGIPPQNSGSPTREPTVCALRELLPALRDRGYRFVTVSELLAEAAR